MPSGNWRLCVKMGTPMAGEMCPLLICFFSDLYHARNLALNRHSYQSTTYGQFPANKAVEIETHLLKISVALIRHTKQTHSGLSTWAKCIGLATFPSPTDCAVMVLLVSKYHYICIWACFQTQIWEITVVSKQYCIQHCIYILYRQQHSVK